MLQRSLLFHGLAFLFLVFSAHARLDFDDDKVPHITPDNMEVLLGSSDTVVVNFYAEWCSHCRNFRPQWNDAGIKVAESVPRDKVRFMVVDCVKEVGLRSDFMIQKYPTVKVFRRGRPRKDEYRGARDVASLVAFAESLAANPIKQLSGDLKSIEDQLADKKHSIVARFPEDQPDGSHELHVQFRKVADLLRDQCGFFLVTESNPSFSATYSFIDGRGHKSDLSLDGKSEFNVILSTIREVCNPLVREITFANGEALTEEGLPFLIMFYDPTDSSAAKASIERFRSAVKTTLQGERERVNFITADGSKFSYPLKVLGKRKSNCPVVAFDTFQRMFLLKNFDDIEDPDKLVEFLEKSTGRKINRVIPASDFDNGADSGVNGEKSGDALEAPKQDAKVEEKKEISTAPDHEKAPNADSKGGPDEPIVHLSAKDARPLLTEHKPAFDKLKPSKNRYSFHEEL